jgi:hypothetical protein
LCITTVFTEELNPYKFFDAAALVDPNALWLPSHVPFHTAKGFTPSLAKQVAAGRFDDVIKTMERNVRLV